MEKEIWKPVKGYEGLYEVSSFGNIRSLDRAIINSKGVSCPLKGLVLKGAKTPQGYLFVILCKNGTRKIRTIHKIVAENFIENPNNLPQINHKDENKKNNRADNLEWCDARYNLSYGSREGMAGTYHSNKVYQYSLDGKLIETFPSTMEASRRYGISQPCISRACLKGTVYKNYKWSYKKLGYEEADIISD